MFGNRERSVVRSSVIPSAKYCWSGSLFKLTNGSTSIDKRGATKGCEIEVVVGALATGAIVADLIPGQNHQALTPITSAAAAPTAIAATAPLRRRGTTVGTLVVGNSAT